MAQGITKGKAWWKKCFQEIYPQSGVTIKAFCKQERVAISCFYTWKKRLALEEKSVTVKTKPVTTDHRSAASTGKEHLFIPIHVDDQASRTSFARPAIKNSANKLEIILANGNIVRLQVNQSEVLEILNLVV
jgi:hypothetical protein